MFVYDAPYNARLLFLHGFDENVPSFQGHADGIEADDGAHGFGQGLVPDGAGDGEVLQLFMDEKDVVCALRCLVQVGENLRQRLVLVAAFDGLGRDGEARARVYIE